jgi:hypothetical protein
LELGLLALKRLSHSIQKSIREMYWSSFEQYSTLIPTSQKDKVKPGRLESKFKVNGGIIGVGIIGNCFYPNHPEVYKVGIVVNYIGFLQRVYVGIENGNVIALAG